jgi:FkbM family methyltransferase
MSVPTPPQDPAPRGSIIYEHGPLRMKRCRYGAMLYAATAPYIGRSFDLYGEYSEAEAVVFKRLAAPGMCVLDAGANIGAHTLVFAQAVGPAGMVIAAEPQRVAVQILNANLALNGIVNTRVLACALGDEIGTIQIPAPDPSRPALGTVSVGQGVERVRIVTIDSLRLPRCDFIKVDVEGFECQVLRGARETVGRTRPLLYVENDRVARSGELLRLLAELGYACHPHAPPLFNPANFFGNPDNVFGGTVSHNLLCVPRERAGVNLAGFGAAVEPGAG